MKEPLPGLKCPVDRRVAALDHVDLPVRRERFTGPGHRVQHYWSNLQKRIVNSIFGQLFKYRPRENRDPKEDFFTEALAGVLQASPALRNDFVYRLIEQEVDQVLVRTQETMPNGRIDIWIDARNRRNGVRLLVAMENKIDANVDPYQLRRYEAQLRSEGDADARTLISATRHERSAFQCLPDAPNVQFDEIHWFQVADFLQNWTSKFRDEGRSDPSVPFVHHLLLLMQEWSMAMTLNVDDLAAATLYHRSVYAQLVQVLEEIKAYCELPGTAGNTWSSSGKPSLYLQFSSPRFGEHQNIQVEFGFDFNRDDADWNVAQLRLPSAYFAVYCPQTARTRTPPGLATSAS